MGKKGDYPQNIGRTLAHGDSLGNHLPGQLGRGQLNPVLQVDLVNIRIRAYCKSDFQTISPIVGAGGAAATLQGEAALRKTINIRMITLLITYFSHPVPP